jgi:cell division protein FtsI/penicillin-binding protein 2
VDVPKIAVVVVVEHGGLGGIEAAPVAQRILQAFFERERG